MANPGTSVVEQKWDAERSKKMAKLRKTKRKLKAKSGKGTDEESLDAAAEGEEMKNVKQPS